MGKRTGLHATDTGPVAALQCLEMFKAILAKAQVDPKLIDDVVVGNVRNDAAAYNVRAAALAAGIPNTSPTLVGE